MLKCLSMAHFFSRNAPCRDGHFWSFCKTFDLDPTTCKNGDSARGEFFEKKCAIDRHLSTEHSPKLRLWRLFDSQNIHDYVRNYDYLAIRRSISTEHKRVYFAIKQTPKAQFWRTLSAQTSVYGALFLEKMPPGAIEYLVHFEKWSSLTLPRIKTRLPSGGIFMRKSAP